MHTARTFSGRAATSSAVPLRHGCITTCSRIVGASPARQQRLNLSPFAHRNSTVVSAVSDGGADTLDQRKQEAKQWIDAWRSGGSSEAPSAPTNGSSTNEVPAPQEVQNTQETSSPQDKIAEVASKVSEAFNSGGTESSGSSGQSSKSGGKYSPDHTFEDGSVLFKSDSLTKVEYPK